MPGAHLCAYSTLYSGDAGAATPYGGVARRILQGGALTARLAAAKPAIAAAAIGKPSRNWRH
jgi:hypothetical protein